MKITNTTKINYHFLIVLGLLVSILASCSKDYLKWTLPEKAVLEVDVITINSDKIEFKGEILNNNIGNIEEIGFLVVRGNDFSLANRFLIESFSGKAYTLTLTEFEFSSYYEVQFYVITEAGESISISKGFDTPSIPGSPMVVLNDYSGLSLDNVNVSANATLAGSTPVISKGFCWSTSPNPTINNLSSNNGSGIGSFSHNITDLNSETTYYIRAYATNQIATTYSNQFEITTKGIGDLAFGDFYQGGLFFYLLKPGDEGYIEGEIHGLLAATEDQGSFAWGCQYIDINTSDAIGSGSNNTELIINNCSQNYIAAKICNDLSMNGFNDWYLPSRGELRLLYENLHVNNIGNFSVIPGDNDYWSSSQFNNFSTWFRSFAVNAENTGSKTGTLRIRAIRKF